MSQIFPSILDAIGNTPVVRLHHLTTRPEVEILAKLEFLNPSGSTKDRPFIHMLEEAERLGEIEPGATIIDSSSGNFAMAMAMAGSVKGYRVICVVDPKLTDLVKQMILSLGAELVCVDEKDETGSYLRSRLRVRDRMIAEIEGAWCPDQYRNKACVAAHYLGTGQEIVEAVDGELDVLVIAAGTGGTISGAAATVKERIPGVKVVAVDAVGSMIFDDEIHPWLQKGLGSGLGARELENMNLDVIDEARLIDDENAFMTARALACHEGLLAGGSSGTVIFAALTLAQQPQLKDGGRILAVLPDRLERYLFEHQQDTWMQERGFMTRCDPETVTRRVREWCDQAVKYQGAAGLPVVKRVRAALQDEVEDRELVGAGTSFRE